MQNHRILYFVASLNLLFFFGVLDAGAFFLTSPLSTYQINSFFDHDNPTLVSNNNFTRYDGMHWTNTASCIFGLNCYDGHNEVDLQAVMNTNVLATAPGILEANYYDLCGGNTTRIWHLQQGVSTLYAHLNQFLVAKNTSVIRSQLIAYSGNSADLSCAVAAHLHFGVRDAQTGGNVLDPYGWSGTTTDPWPHNQGYLWTTYPPSLNPNSATYVSGNISQNTIWTTQGSPYVVQGNLTLSTSTTLTINPGVVVKFENIASFQIYGSLISLGGTSTSTKIYFTSINDDAIGGDTNGNGINTFPAPGDYFGFYFYPGSSGNFANATFRYGGNDVNPPTFYTGSFGVIKNFGGAISLTASEISSNLGIGLLQTGGILNLDTVLVQNNSLHSGSDISPYLEVGFNQNNGTSTIINSHFSGNPNFGIYLKNGTSTIINNSFSNHSTGDININSPVSWTQFGNMAFSGGPHGIFLSGSLNHSQQLEPGIAYVISDLTVNAGVTLNIKAGAIIKFGQAGKISVFGNLVGQGGVSTSTRIYFTSINDDTIGGDTNGNGATTMPAANDYRGIYFYPGSTGNLTRATFRYGGTESFFTSYLGVIKNLGGILTLTAPDISFAYGNGLKQVSGNTFLTGALIHHNSGSGFEQTNGTSTIADSSFFSNQNYGISLQNGSSTINDNAFNSHGLGDININASAFWNEARNLALLSGPHGIFLSGSLNHSQQLGPGIPYVIPTSSLTVNSNRTLTMSPGTVVKFNPSSSITVIGNLVAQGGASTSTRIYFTSINDDAIGGDTNGNGNSTLPAPGSYNGLRFLSGSAGSLTNTVLRYGGNYFPPNYLATIQNFGGALNLTNTKMTNNQYGIYHSFGTTSISQSSIYGNIIGLFNANLATTTAANNWWGSASGPNHPTLNPTGAGSAILGNINFSPWLLSDPN